MKSCTKQSADAKQLEESMSLMSGMPEAARLSSLLHLTCLLFEVSSYMYQVHTGFVQVLEILDSPGILLWNFLGLESSGNR